MRCLEALEALEAIKAINKTSIFLANKANRVQPGRAGFVRRASPWQGPSISTLGGVSYLVLRRATQCYAQTMREITGPAN